MKIKILVLLFAVTINLTAQSVKETKTVFGNPKLHTGYFLSPACNLANIAGSVYVLPGLGAGVIFNEKFTLGLSYKFIVNEKTPDGEDNRLYLDQKYGGVKVEYTIFPQHVIHPNFRLEAGMGHTELDLKDAYEGGDVPQTDANFAYLEPGVALEINFWKYLKVDAGIGYRFISDFSFRNFSEKDFMGISYSAALKIGLF